MWYDNTIGNWNLGMGGGNITQQVGEELHGLRQSIIRHYLIAHYKMPRLFDTGVVGASGVITFAPTTLGITEHKTQTIGVATEKRGFKRIWSYYLFRRSAWHYNQRNSLYGETWADGDVIWWNPGNR